MWIVILFGYHHRCDHGIVSEDVTMNQFGMTDREFGDAERFYEAIVGGRRFDEWCGVTGEEAETAEECDNGDE